MSEPQGTGKMTWFRLGTPDVVFMVLALGILASARHSMLDDPGLGWHLRNVDAMFEQSGWLTTDPFTRPRDSQPRPWLTNQWFGDLLLRGGEWWGGLEGIAVVTTLVLAATLCCLYCLLARDGLPWPLAALWTYLAALGTSTSWVSRPNIASILFVLLTAHWCEAFHRGTVSWRRLLWLLPLFTVWANTHGGFVAGLVILATVVAIEVSLALFSLERADRQAAQRRAMVLATVTAGVFLATLVNPYGVRLYAWVFQLLGDRYFMSLHTEWQSPDFHALGAFRYELLILLLPLLLGVSGRKPTLVALGLTVVWLHFGLAGRRYMPLWVVVAVPMLARTSTEVPWLKAVLDRMKLSADARAFWGARPQSAPSLYSAIAALALLGWARGSDGVFHHHPQYIPAAALDRLLEVCHGRIVFHDYNWGGYLTWHGWPGFLNWIDDRNEVQGQEHVKDYFALIHTEPGWQQRLREADIQLVAIHPQTPLAYRLSESNAWKSLHRDEYAVIFERQPNRASAALGAVKRAAPESKALISRLAQPMADKQRSLTACPAGRAGSRPTALAGRCPRG